MSDRKARYERRQRARSRRFDESRKASRWYTIKFILVGSGALLLVVLVIGGILLFASTRKTLPPTSFSVGHSEAFPPQKINSEPIPRRIQEHVMERGGSHLDGSMLVQYNCEDYDCEPDLESKLEDIVRNYPPQVYLAPYPRMDAMIALAAPGRLEILDGFDKDRIIQFIEKNLNR